jgi:hypothetical protein
MPHQSKRKSTSMASLSSSKTKRVSSMKGKKVHRSMPSSEAEGDIVVMFMEILMMVKLYHWKTYSYAQHKATDDFYGSLNEHMDTFIEILMGKTGMRIDLLKQKKINLMDLSNLDQFKQKLEDFKKYLVNLDHMPLMKTMTNTDLLNIRDEILGDVNKLLYLLSLE